jgi:hypothetical protein
MAGKWDGLQFIALGRDRWARLPDVPGVAGDVWVRTFQESDGRWRIGTLMVDTMPSDEREGGAITRQALRSIPLADFERYVNDLLGAKPAEPTANYVPKGYKHTDPLALLRDLPASKASAARRARRSSARYRLRSLPPDGQLTDDYLSKVVRAYHAAVDDGQAPAPAIAADTGATVRTVRSWVHKARQRGLMPPGRPGHKG